LADYDQELFLDFENPLIVKVWLQSIKNKDKITLREFLFDPETPIQDKNGGKYMNEFIASVINQKPSFFKTDILSTTNHQKERTFSPGSEWMYLKYYCGKKTADYVLAEAIKPLVSSLIRKKFIDKWFFIRYEDSDNHIRLRLHLFDERHLDEILQLNKKFLKVFEKENLVWKIQLDTYNREIERYTYDSIEDSEELFFHDSICVLNFLSETPGPIKDLYSWLWAIKGVDELLNDFTIGISEKIKICKELKEAYYQELKIEKNIKHQIDAKFRKYKKELEQVLMNSNINNLSKFSFNLFQKRSEKIKPIARRILATQKNKPEILNELIKSYIHMFLNRALPHSQRLQEMIFYDFMFRHYKSLEARKEKTIF
jgi:thiopeptide-type bacteriocin biosynthesis protein